MTELKRYKYATFILAVAVVVLIGALLYRSAPATIGSVLETVNQQLRSCRDRVAEWQAENPASEALSEEARTALGEVLENCFRDVQEAGEIAQ